MRIISRFKDFYDFCSAYGTDNSFTYIRASKKYSNLPISNFRFTTEASPRIFETARWRFCDIDSEDRAVVANTIANIAPVFDFENIKYMGEIPRDCGERMNFPLYHVVVLFCGRLYSYFVHRDFISDCVNDIKPYWFKNELQNSNVVWQHQIGGFKFDRIVEYGEIVSCRYDFTDIHFTFRSPDIAFVREYGLFSRNSNYSMIVSPVLRNLLFHNFIDGNRAFQEIENMVGLFDVMERKQTPDPIPNDCRITGHGFDIKKSFRHR